MIEMQNLSIGICSNDCRTLSEFSLPITYFARKGKGLLHKIIDKIRPLMQHPHRLVAPLETSVYRFAEKQVLAANDGTRLREPHENAKRAFPVQPETPAQSAERITSPCSEIPDPVGDYFCSATCSPGRRVNSITAMGAQSPLRGIASRVIRV